MGLVSQSVNYQHEVCSGEYRKYFAYFENSEMRIALDFQRDNNLSEDIILAQNGKLAVS